jgi:hypothetical protein
MKLRPTRTLPDKSLWEITTYRSVYEMAVHPKAPQPHTHQEQMSEEHVDCIANGRWDGRPDDMVITVINGTLRDGSTRPVEILTHMQSVLTRQYRRIT